MKSIPNASKSGVGQTHGRCQPVRLAGSVLGRRCHVCAFFRDQEEEHRILLPFIKEAFDQGHKLVHTVDPRRRSEQLQSLESAGIDVAAVRKKGQFELRDWYNTHLRDGHFDGSKTLSLYQEVVKTAREQGFSITRFVTHMEWAVESGLEADDLLEYEARANAIWDGQEGPVNPVICSYDLKKFGGDIVVDIIRTHPMIIIGGILQENPFYVSTEDFLRELQDRRAVRLK